ncbi:polyphosphoinositide phosphatase [Gorgonomyces haynaldii]|nr:polyphosphoinositide phosphatase [Gorgonomyces haynaldii]
MRLRDFDLYETKTRLMIVGTNDYMIYRIAKIDKASDFQFVVDPVSYTKREVEQILEMMANGNRASGGLKLLTRFYGIFGFVDFLGGKYMILITKRSQVALLGGHAIYHIDDTLMFSIAPKVEKQEEMRYLQIFTQMDINKSFYYSYSYDLSQSLQRNLQDGQESNLMFVWNHFLTENVYPNDSPFLLPIIHGFVDQSKVSVFGHNIFVTLIARRSRLFAGARFLKRGSNDNGQVANDVETEQIVFDCATTFFPGSSYSQSRYSSFLQHRGSIPLYWSQEGLMAAKPSIQMDLIDPFYTAAARHFDNLLQRYGSPIMVLNLVKAKEKIRREGILLQHFTEAISYLNQGLPEQERIRYIAWDMARASKSPDQDVIKFLEKIAQDVIAETRFFVTGKNGTTLQSGILRTNCIDCLDRTNAAQFVAGKVALEHQLHALGIIGTASLPFDCDAVNLLNAMYHDHGDTIALQYGGSHLVNTMETYRKISRWTTNSRDMIESVKRYYSNSFTDAEKQAAMNLFLGIYQPKKSLVHLWDLPTDFYLHNDPPFIRNPPKSYIKWFNPENLEIKPFAKKLLEDMFERYYNPRRLEALGELFAFKIVCTANNAEDLVSPFSVRPDPQHSGYLMLYSLNIGGVKRWLALTDNEQTKEDQNQPEKIKEERKTQEPRPAGNTARLAMQHLEPLVSEQEEEEYKRYTTQFSSGYDMQESPQLHPEYQLFKRHVSLAQDPFRAGFQQALPIQDENAYKKYILSGSFEANVGLGALSNNLLREEGYQGWLRSGKFINPRKITPLSA